MSKETPSSSDDLRRFGLDDGDEWLKWVRDARAARPAKPIGEYEVIEEIARGGQGVVYRARQPGTRREVALKRITAGALASLTARMRFVREIETASALDHPNVVKVYGAEVSDDVTTLAMEWIDGQPIDEWALAPQPKPLNQVLEVFLKACEGVRHAHQRGVIHRDLKPNNVLVDQHDEPHVLDFGLAKALTNDPDSDSNLTLTEEFVGTPAYAAPEQIEPGGVHDVRTDVYSLGVVLYRLVTGRRPYGDKPHLADLLQAIRNAEISQPSSHNRALNRELDAIVLKALRKDPEQRYQSVEALQSDIRRHLSGEAVLAHPPSLVYRLRKQVRRNKVAVGFVLVLAASATASTMLYLRAENQRHLAGIAASAANAAQADAEANLKLAKRRAAELEQVAQFQSSMLSGLDAERMGRTMVVQLRAAAADALAKDGQVSAAQRDEILASFDRAIRRANPTTIAVNTLDDEVFARSVRAIDDEFADQPLVRATLLLTIANAYREMGLYAKGEPLAREALRLRQKALGPEHPDVATDLNDLALLLHEQGELESAETIYREALGIRRRAYGNDHPAVATSLHNLAGIMFVRGDYDEAESLQRDALRIRRQDTESPTDLAYGLLALASTLQARGDYENAEPLLREALEVWRGEHGDEHPLVASALHHLGSLLMNKGESEAAEPLMRQALEMRRRLLGDEHPDIAASLSNLGLLLQNLGRLSEAEPLLREALEIDRNSLGPDNPAIASSLNNLAIVLVGQGKREAAVPLLQDALNIRRTRLGDRHPRVITSLSNLAYVLQAGGDLTAAVELYREALALSEELFGATDPAAGEALVNLSIPLLTLKRFQEAEQFELRAYEIYSAAFGESNEKTVMVVERLATLYETWHVEQPDAGYEQQATTWRNRLSKDEGKAGDSSPGD